MEEHVGVGRIRQGAVALAGLDAAAQLLRLTALPHRGEVVVVLTEVAHRLGPDTAGPNVSVRSDLRRCHAGHARDDLAVLPERALHDLVVLAAERLSHRSDPVEL